ncbi:MAG TPA: hypothetical protein VGK73_11060 [Polyangiaceae bacterium]
MAPPTRPFTPGLGAWFVVLDVVSAEVFRMRLRVPEASVDVKSIGEQHWSSERELSRS